MNNLDINTEDQVDADLIVDDQLDDLEREVTDSLRQTVRTVRTAYLNLHRIIEDIKEVANMDEEDEDELVGRGSRIAVEMVKDLVDGGDELLRENEELKATNRRLKDIIVNMATDRYGPPPAYAQH